MDIYSSFKNFLDGLTKPHTETYYVDPVTRKVSNTPPPTPIPSPTPFPGPQNTAPITPQPPMKTQPQPAYTPAPQTPIRPMYQPNPSQNQGPITRGRNPNTKNFNISPVVDSAIHSAANEFQIPASLLYDISLQESSFNPNLRNETPSGRSVGVPVGLFQFTPDTWQTVNNYAHMPGSSLTNWNNPAREDPYANARAAAYLIKNGQLGRWEASKGSWGPLYKPDELKSYYSQTPGYNPTGQ